MHARATPSFVRALGRSPVAVAVLAFVLLLPGVWWGLPHATAPERIRPWGVDDETPLGPLAEVHNIFEPKADRNLGYPLMYSFMAAAASAPWLGWWYITGEWRSPSPAYPYGFRDPAHALARLGLMAHLVTMLMSIATIVACYDIGRVARGPAAGWISAGIAALAFPMAYYARTGNVDATMIAFTALAFAAFARCVILGITRRRALGLGAAIGFALATKEAALGAFLPLPFALLLLRRKEIGELRSWTAWSPLLAALLVAFLALGIGSGLFVDPGRYFAHLRFISGRLDTLAAGGTEVVPTFGYNAAGHIAYARALLTDLAVALTWPGLILACTGILACVIKRERLAWLAAPGVAYVLWIFLTLRAAQLRYMLPAASLLAPFVALAIHQAFATRRSLGRIATAAAALALGLLLLRSTDLTYQMVRDSRYAAARWLRDNTRPGDRIEHFGPAQKLPPLQAGVVNAFAAPYHGMYVAPDVSDAAADRILNGWLERRPTFVVAIPDFTSEPGIPHSRSFPPQLYRAMLENRTPFRLVAFFQTPRLFPWLPTANLDYPTVNPPIRIFRGPW
jgi:hypothetical protein